jgi:hypothetical protein
VGEELAWVDTHSPRTRTVRITILIRPDLEVPSASRLIARVAPASAASHPLTTPEEYGAMADQWYRHGTGFLLVYSITDRPTFEALAGLHQNILRVKDREGGNVPCVVVSNKVSGWVPTPC